MEKHIFFDFNGTIINDIDLCLDLLNQILENCVYGWGDNNPLIGNIDNVNYADIIPTQIEPNQTNC